MDLRSVAILIGVIAAALSCTATPAHAARGGTTLRCESVDAQPRTCAADTRSGVRLGRQLSRAACVEGTSWGAVPDGIWVKDGCRAEFVLGFGASSRGGYGAQVVRCDSLGNRWSHCVADPSSGFEVVRQRSDRPCILGQTWGWDDRGIWVSAGCRADFRAKLDDDAPRPDAARVVRCESRDGRSTHCAVGDEAAVRLRRQLSKAECVKGRSWGVDDDGIWVARGCRADFELVAQEGN